jgi:hypothetical protein
VRRRYIIQPVGGTRNHARTWVVSVMHEDGTRTRISNALGYSRLHEAKAAATAHELEVIA